MNDERTTPAKIRAFLAIAVPQAVIDKLQELQDRLRAEWRGVSWSRPEQQHLTLQFYGNVPAETIHALRGAIERVCGHTPPFRLQAGKLGTFANRIIWVGIGGGLKSLLALTAEVALATRGFGDHEELRVFHPHLTIGRIKTRPPGREKFASKIQEWSSTRFGEWGVDHVELMQSDLSPRGATYSCLARIALAGEAPQET